MYAEFSYDLVPGTLPNEQVLERILEKFDLKPNGEERRRCDLLSDTFICEIANLNDYRGHEQASRAGCEPTWTSSSTTRSRSGRGTRRSRFAATTTPPSPNRSSRPRMN